MKKRIAMLLCILLVLTMTLTGCGDKKNFITALQSATQITRYDSELELNFSVKGLEEIDNATMSALSAFLTVDGDTLSGVLKVKIEANDDRNTKATISLGGTEITDLTVTDGVVYLNYRSFLTFIAGAAGSAMLPAGKDYIKLDPAELAGSAAEEADSESQKADSYLTALWQGINTFSTLLETAAKDIEPEVMFQKDGSYCFQLTSENITAFAHKLGDVLSSDFEKLYNEYITALKAEKNCEDIAAQLEANKSELMAEVASAADTLKAFQYQDSMKFSATANTSLTGKEGSRSWTLGMNLSMSQEEKSATVSLSYKANERKDTKEIGIDQSKVMTEEDSAAMMGSLFGTDYSDQSQGEEIGDWEDIDTSAWTEEDWENYINGIE